MTNVLNRQPPPPGYITAKEAKSILGNKMLYRYVEQNLIERTPRLSGKQGYYKLEDVLRVKKTLAILSPQPENELKTIFAVATPDDMDGVYLVAIELFPHGTTSAQDRKPLVATCPDGNYIVRDHGEIVAYWHMQPLKPEIMKAFLNGAIIGKDIRSQDLELLTPGKPIDFLIKSVGATRKDGEDRAAHYMQRMLLGIRDELKKLGERGIIIRRIYTTTQTNSSLALAIHAHMHKIRTLKKPQGDKPGRYAYELDVATSDLPLLKPYKEALLRHQDTQE